MRLGSLFAGIGGLDLACEWALGAEAVWQLDRVGERVRRRHWPDVLHVQGDVEKVDPSSLPAIDVLAGGFPCQDLSQAGSGEGLDGARSGLYRELVRFARILQPDVVVIENVPRLLKYRERLERDWTDLGFGLTWVKCRAIDAGAPHIRRRVFVIARRGAPGRGLLEAPAGGTSDRPWPTATAVNPNEGEDPESFARRSQELVDSGSRPISEPLGQAVRPWPTPTAGDAKSSGSRNLDSEAHSGTSLTDAIRLDRTTAEERHWSTPSGMAGGQTSRGGDRKDEELLGGQVRTEGSGGKRLNPDWVETLMGLPVGWTDVGSWQLGLFGSKAHRLVADPDPRWPRGRYPKDWDRTQHWPGHDWEPARVLPDGGPIPGRTDRLRQLGNAVVPQQGALAIRTALD